MIEQFSFDIQLIFAILNGKVSAANQPETKPEFSPEWCRNYPPNSGLSFFFYGKKMVSHSKNYVMPLLKTNPA